jgi:hypothetical protein
MSEDPEPLSPQVNASGMGRLLDVSMRSPGPVRGLEEDLLLRRFGSTRRILSGFGADPII